MNSKLCIFAVSMSLGLVCFAVKGMKPEDQLFKGSCTGSLILLEGALVMGAQIEARDSFRMTALQWAAFNGHQECLKVLLEKGAQIGVKDCVGMTALHRAARAGHQECLKILIQKGAQIDAKNNAGMTPLYMAIIGGHIKCLTVVLLAATRVIIDGTSCCVIAPSEDHVELSRRRLKVALLALRYAGSDSDEDKAKNRAGDLIVSNDYMRSWFLLSHSGTRADLFTVLLSLLAKGKKVDYALFRLVKEELGDYLVMKLRDTLRKINASQFLPSVAGKRPASEQFEIGKLCDPELAEENFGNLIRSVIRAKFSELLRATGSQESASLQSASSSQSSSSVKEQSAITSR